ncbi:alpha/beta fold hydrolase [Streptomyces sp. AV19]|uniref:alpha/beta hydrolase n=1 Tax=Streptomyces sp. AV19 TaxID=2793068 RepID=UPI0018FEED0E|nr:alpha/beta hydrolase [Streptomyces sp. AV19]MBH1935698.1 alpha/beta fold hydrolase [Streptomyces sp. AV19]MDG4536027.1 alpha/beta hydrolase [Streptomyces sp. AV19]
MSPPRPRALALASAALALVLAAGCGPGGGGGGRDDVSGKSGSRAGSRIDWKPCAAPTVAQGGGKAPGKDWECASLPVPLDYARPDGKTIGLALIRARATDEKHRLGSLVFNFGGPGGSGVSTLPSFGKSYADLRKRYDLVSFDPRGVGESAGVRCLTDKELDAADRVDATPDDDTEVTAAVELDRRYARACGKNAGQVLAHVDTLSAARDMDRLRAALGEDRLRYFGISYGTELGAVYAHLFPAKVGRAVLDAVVDPRQDPAQGALAQAKGFQLALDDYLKDCGADCPAQSRITALLKRLDSKPLPTALGRPLSQDQAVNGIAAALYSKDTWKYLTAGLREATAKGTGTTLLLLSDSLAGRDPEGRYSNLQAANRAISCADAEQRYAPAEVKALLPQFRSASPVFGESAAWALLQCTDWPVKGKWKTPESSVSAKGSAPILVVGNTGDPATPYEGARRMAEALGPAAVEVTYKGEGHGAYNSGNACMKALVDGYLLEGRVPARGATCS